MAKVNTIDLTGKYIEPDYFLGESKIINSGRLFLFSKLKLPLRGIHFQLEYAFKKCFDAWIIPWHTCIISGDAYFDGDKINLDE